MSCCLHNFTDHMLQYGIFGILEVDRCRHVSFLRTCIEVLMRDARDLGRNGKEIGIDGADPFQRNDDELIGEWASQSTGQSKSAAFILAKCR